MEKNILDTKNVLITGGLGLLGKLMCTKLKQAGYRVFLLDRADPAIIDSELLSSIDDYFMIDLSKTNLYALENEEVRRLFDLEVDVLIINAFPRLFDQFVNIGPNDIYEFSKAAFSSQVVVLNHFFKKMYHNNKGRLIYIGSKSAFRGYSRGGLYCSLKMAHHILYESLERELSLSRKKIYVTVIHPDSFSKRSDAHSVYDKRITNKVLSALEKSLSNEKSQIIYAFKMKTRINLFLRYFFNAFSFLFK